MAQTEKSILIPYQAPEPPPAMAFVYPGLSPLITKPATQTNGMEVIQIPVQHARVEEEDPYNPLYDELVPATLKLAPGNDSLFLVFDDGTAINLFIIYTLRGELLFKNKLALPLKQVSFELNKLQPGYYRYLVRNSGGKVGKGAFEVNEISKNR